MPLDFEKSSELEQTRTGKKPNYVLKRLQQEHATSSGLGRNLARSQFAQLAQELSHCKLAHVDL